MIDIETTEAFLKVIDYLSEKFGVTINYASNDLLPYLKTLGDKIVAYEMGISLMWIIVGILIILSGIAILIIGCIKDCEYGHIFYFIVALIIGGIIIINNLYTYIGCITFEEKIILDYIDTMMKSQSVR